MTDRELLADLIAKLHEMQEQLSMAQLETTSQSLLASRIRHLSILALYVRTRLEGMAESASLPPKAGDEVVPDSSKRP
ncbi:MAG TPA: hypothetical protein VM183_07430 [Burkholderiales bacterium]|nr:hypothetical protein [Burkholderiales bacterium]